MKFLHKASTLTILAAMLPTAAQAVDPRQLPGVVDRTLPNFTIPAAPEGDAHQPLKAAPTIEKTKNQNKVVGTLNAINFTGTSVIPEEELQAAAVPYLHREITNADIAKLKYDLAKMFYDRGYILVKITTPPQDLSTGVLEIQIYEAHVGQTHIQDNGVVRPIIPQAISEEVHQGDVFREQAIESMISDIDDLDGVKASVTLTPGKEFGTTDLNISTRPANEDVNYVQLDNYGSKYTGRDEATAHVEKGNLLHMGEKLEATVRGTDARLWSVSVGAVTPIGVRNLSLETYYLHSEDKIREAYTGPAIRETGNSDVTTLGLTSNLINTKKEKATLRAGMEVRDYSSSVNHTQNSGDDLRDVYGEASYLRREPSSVWYGAVKVNKGIDMFGASSKSSVELSRAGGNPEAVRIEPVLLANFKVKNYGMLKVVTSGQIADDTLVSPDLFVLGGYGSVRGFDLAQTTGESGYQFSLEYLQDVNVNEDWTIGAGPFFDGGSVYNRLDSTVSGITDSHLYSAGLGLEATTSKLVPVGDTTFRADWAHPIGNYVADVPSDMFYLRVRQDF